MTTHDLAVPDESQERQVFCVGFSHEFVHAQRYYFEESDHDEFTHMVLTNIKMTRELSALDFRSSQHKQCCVRTEDWLEFEKPPNWLKFYVGRSLLANLVSCDKFCLGSGK